MGAPTDTFQTYQSIGNREDLIDVITNISPIDTWVTSNTGSTRAKATYHEWQTDALAAAAANKKIEGDDVTATAVVPTVRTGNYTQILRKDFVLSGTQEVIDKAGRDSERSYQKAKCMKELARDIEYALVINASAVSGASGTARELKGLLGWIATNVTTGTATTNEQLTESMLNDNLQLVWAAGGKPSTILCGAYQKRKISGFTSNTKEVNAEAKKLVLSVDVYDSDFGKLRVHLHHQMNTSASDKLIVLGDMDLIKKAWLRPPKWDELAKTGDAEKHFVVAELTLEMRQEKGHGKITELATS